MLQAPTRLSAEQYCDAILSLSHSVLGINVLTSDSATCNNMASRLASMRVLGHGSYSVVLTNEHNVYKISFFHQEDYIIKEALLGLYFHQAAAAKDPAVRWFAVPSYPAGIWLPSADDSRLWSRSTGAQRGRMVSTIVKDAAKYYRVGAALVPHIDITDVLPLDAALTVRCMVIGAQGQEVPDAVLDNTYARDVLKHSQRTGVFCGYLIQQQEFAGAASLKSMLPEWLAQPARKLGAFLYIVFRILDRLNAVAAGFVHMDLGTPNVAVADLASLSYKAAEHYNSFRVAGQRAAEMSGGAVPRIIDMQMAYVDVSTACTDLDLGAQVTARVARTLQPTHRPFYGSEDVRRLGLWLVFEIVQQVGVRRQSACLATILLAMHMITFRQPWFDAAANAGGRYAEFAAELRKVYLFVRNMLAQRLELPGAPTAAQWNMCTEAPTCLQRITVLLQWLNDFMCTLAVAAGVRVSFYVLMQCEREFKPVALAESVQLLRCISVVK